MLKRLLIICIALSVMLVAWQLIEDAVTAQHLVSGETPPEAFIPTPHTILVTFIHDGRMLLREASYTLSKALVGFGIGAVLAFLGASLFLIIPGLRTVAYPLAFALNSFPVVGLAPVIILAFGQGSVFSIIFIAALICYFPMLLSFDAAFRETNKDLLEFMQVIRASRWQTLRTVHLPAAMSYFFLSLKLAIPASIIGATIGEWLGSRTGIGQIITIALYQLRPGLLYAALLLIVVISSLSILALHYLEFFLFPWKRTLKK